VDGRDVRAFTPVFAGYARPCRRGSAAAEPIVALVFPIAAEIFVGDGHLITCFGFLKPSLVGMRTFMGNPNLTGKISPSNRNVIWVCGCSAVAMSMEVE